MSDSNKCKGKHSDQYIKPCQNKSCCPEVITLQFILSQIRKEAHNKPMTFDEQVDISSIKNLHEDIREAGQAQVFGSCHLDGDEKIGRASCSERGKRSWVGGRWE